MAVCAVHGLLCDPLQQTGQLQPRRLRVKPPRASPRRVADWSGLPRADRRCRAGASARDAAPAHLADRRSGRARRAACPACRAALPASASISSGGGCPASATVSRRPARGLDRDQADRAQVGARPAGGGAPRWSVAASLPASGRASLRRAACDARAPSRRPPAGPCRRRRRSRASSRRRTRTRRRSRRRPR